MYSLQAILFTVDPAWLERIQRCTKRSLNAALELTIWTERRGVDDMGDDIWDYEVAMRQLRPVLTPLVPRIKTLNIEIRNYSQEFLQALLAFFASPKASPVHSLILRCTFESERLEPLRVFPWKPIYLANAWDDESPIHDFLRSVRCLTLQSILVPIGNDAYSGLTELRLHEVELNPESARKILASSPALYTLSITKVKLSSGPLPESVALPSLRFITLGSRPMKEKDIGVILALIKTTSANVSLHLLLSGYGQDKDMIPIRAFFERSQIISLHLEMERTGKWFELLRNTVHHLEVLTFEGCDVWDPDLETFIEALDELGHPDPWPKLHALYLIDSWVHPKIMIRLLKLHKVEFLRLVDRRKPFHDYHRLEPYWTLERLQKAISELGIDAECSGECMYLSRAV